MLSINKIYKPYKYDFYDNDVLIKKIVKKTHTSLFGLICLINDIRDLLKQPEQNIIRKI